MLPLLDHRRCPRIARNGHLRCAGPCINPAAPSVIAGARASRIRHRVVVDVHIRVGHIGDRAVVGNAAVSPIRAVVAATRVAEAVVDPAIESDVRTPVPHMLPISVALITPPRRRPQRANPRSRHPRSRHPVIVVVGVVPVARRPDVILARTRRLAVLGKRRWGHGGFRITRRRGRAGGFRIRPLVAGRLVVRRRCRRCRREIPVGRIAIGKICTLILRFIAGGQARKYEDAYN
jgi:hypothetical protein